MVLTYNKPLVIISLTSLLFGCSSFGGGNPNFLPDGGPTSLEVYDGARNDTQSDTAGPSELYNEQTNLQYERDLGPWVRTQSTELQNRFPVIPNLEITGFVFPHLSPGGHPVPGYATRFSVYEREHYALPGEAATVPITEQQSEAE